MTSLPAVPTDVAASMLRQNLSRVRQEITAAARAYGRDPQAIALLAVSKQQPASAIRVLAGLGQREFGESYLQEALPKLDARAAGCRGHANRCDLPSPFMIAQNLRAAARPGYSMKVVA